MVWGWREGDIVHEMGEESISVENRSKAAESKI
jgi:hypothetical protein